MMRLLLLCLALGLPAAVSAQISYPADTTAAYAQAEGQEAADADFRGDRAILAIAGGALLGTTTPRWAWRWVRRSASFSSSMSPRPSAGPT